MKFIPVMEPDFSGNEAAYLQECIETGWISSVGSYVTRFEENFAAYCGTRYALATNNGTAALHLALMSLEIGPGDEVIVPDLTFVATANVVEICRARPVLCDVDPLTWNMDSSKVEALITERTKAIIPVHLYGLCSIDERLLEISRKHKIPLVEDAAEAPGATWRGVKTGKLGLIGCFSFFGNKIITSGEGGMLTTDDPEIYQKALLFRNQGMEDKKKYWHLVIGHNFRMTNLQAAVGVAQLERIDYFLSRRKEVAAAYHERLSDLPGLRFAYNDGDYENVFWLFSMILEDFPLSRDELIAHLKESGIDARPFFYPIHIQPPFKYLGGEYPVAEYLGARGLNLPSSPHLKEEEIDYICSAVRKVAG